MTLPYFRPIITEFDVYLTPDGLEYFLSSPDVRWSFGLTGSGMPPIEYVSQRGPYQHGETLLDYFLRPRTIQMIVRHNQSSRNSYWHQRLQLLDVLRPNRQLIGALAPGRLRKIFPDGRKLDLDVVIEQGPTFNPDQVGQWDAWSFQEVIRFKAHNPIFYNPTRHDTDLVNTETGVSLIFPLNDPTLDAKNTFDGIAGIVFDEASGNNTETTIDYEGTWEEYPTIILTGPITNPVITNTTTGDKLALTYVLQAGAVITINLSYGQKTITLDDGTNLIGFLTTDSDLATFRLIPGENVITVIGSGITSGTTLQLQYYDRYIGY